MKDFLIQFNKILIDIIFTIITMGRVRTKTVKRAAKVLLERHFLKLTNDFHINKKILSEVAKVPTKSLRNKIAGFATHLMKRIQKGPVKGISLKVQQQERQRRLDWVPKESEIKIDSVNVDAQTAEMLKKRFGEDFFGKIQSNLAVKSNEAAKRQNKKRRGGDKRQGRGGARQPRQKRQPREPREQKEPREPRKPKEGEQGAQQAQTEQPKRQGRRRGRGEPREGQQ